MSNRNGNSNRRGNVLGANCNGTLAENDNCCNRRNFPAADALEDAYNAGYREGYCAGVRDERENGQCEAYEQGVRDGCQNTKQEALNCIKGIRCC